MPIRPSLIAGRKNSQAYRGVILSGTAMLFWFSLYTYPSILAPYLSDMKISLSMTGIVLGSYGLTQTIMRLPLGILSDRLGNKRIFIVVGMLLALLSGVGLFLFRDVRLILLFRGMAGVAAAVWVHFSTLYLSYYPAQAAAPALGRLNAGSSLSQMAAMLAGGYLAQHFGWPAAFLAAGAAALPGLLLSFGLLEKRAAADLPAADNSPPSLRAILQLGRNRQLFWTSILALLSQLVVFATIQGFVPQYASLLGADKATLGLLLVFAMLPRALAAFLGGSLLARWFRLKALIVFGLVLLGLVTILLPLIHHLSWLFVSQFFGGIGIGIQYTLLMSLCTQTVAENRKASAMSFFQAVYGIGMVIGPVVVGFLADRFNLATGFFTIGIVSLLAAILAALAL